MLQRGQPRPAVLAGLWYPSDPSRLSAMVQDYLRDAAPSPSAAPAAIVSPHAGYRYSGPTAGVAWSAAALRRPRRVIIVGPAHRVGFRGVSAGDFSSYRCPLGDIPVDRAAIAALDAEGLVTCVAEAHEEEHCIEIMLPFLAATFGTSVPMVPLLVGRATNAEVAAVLDRVVTPEDLLVVSTDLSHFLPYDVARQRDLATLDGVSRGETARLEGETACGFRGLAATLELASRRDWRVEILDYKNSGDTAGDRGRVVGYGAAALVPTPAL